MRNGDAPNQNPTLVHVHRCAGCGARARRGQLNGRDSILGLYECPGCGQKGPLNIEIVEESILDN